MKKTFTSAYFSCHQDNRSRLFTINFGHKTIPFSFCDLMMLREKVNQISSHNHMVTLIDSSNIEIISVCNREHILILEISQIIDLKYLIEYIFTGKKQENLIISSV